MVSESKIDARLQELHEQLERGHSRLAQLEREREQLRDTLLRINGAIQVLEELRGTKGQDDSLGGEKRNLSQVSGA